MPKGLGFTTDDSRASHRDIPGGWQMRLARAAAENNRTCCCSTNRRTISIPKRATGQSLEEYLNGYPHAVILVSHDRFFRFGGDTHADPHALHLDDHYVGNYSDYLVTHEARIEQLRKAKREQDEEVAREDVHRPVPLPGDQGVAGAEPHRCSRRLSRSRCRPSARRSTNFPVRRATHGARVEARAQGLRSAGGLQRPESAHRARGDRIALVGHNGAGKVDADAHAVGEEQPDRESASRATTRHAVLRGTVKPRAMDPNPTVHDTLSSGSLLNMVPMIVEHPRRPCSSGDDITRKVRVLSGGERTRLAVARMLLRPSFHAAARRTDEPPRSDSKDVLLTRWSSTAARSSSCRTTATSSSGWPQRLSKLATVACSVYPGTAEFLWHKEHPDAPGRRGICTTGKAGQAAAPTDAAKEGQCASDAGGWTTAAPPAISREERKRPDAESSKVARAAQQRKAIGRRASRSASPRPKRRFARSKCAWRRRASTMTTAAAQKAADEHQAPGVEGGRADAAVGRPAERSRPRLALDAPTDPLSDYRSVGLDPTTLGREPPALLSRIWTAGSPPGGVAPSHLLPCEPASEMTLASACGGHVRRRRCVCRHAGRWRT